MNGIMFSVEWDKLKEPRFTTIRSYNPKKMSFYEHRVGEDFDLIKTNGRYADRGHKIGSATLRSCRLVEPGRLPHQELVKDVLNGGKANQEWMDKLLAMPTAILLEFENHTGLLE